MNRPLKSNGVAPRNEMMAPHSRTPPNDSGKDLFVVAKNDHVIVLDQSKRSKKGKHRSTKSKGDAINSVANTKIKGTKQDAGVRTPPKKATRKSKRVTRPAGKSKTNDIESGGSCLEVFERPGLDDSFLTQATNDTEQASCLRFGTNSSHVSLRSDLLGRAKSNQHLLPQRKNSVVPSSPSSCYHFNHRFRSFLKDATKFRALKISQIVCSIYIAVLTFADIGPPGGLRDPETGFIIDSVSPKRTEQGLILVNGTERAIVATSAFQLACIGVARLSAWFMYPALVFVFISKFRATTSFLAKSPLAMYMYGDLHELHVYCGWTIVICALIHTASHIARWAVQGNMNLLVGNVSGVSGLIIILSCILICIPMTLFRDRIKYEIRKKFHYLFIVFAMALAFHTPASAIPNGGFTAYVFGTLLAWYFLDTTYCCFFMTEKIDTTKFSVLPSGVRMTMNVSERFQKMGTQGGICYVCLPWIAKEQWHAFSLFEDPSNPAERQIFIQKTGDWTTKLHQHLQRDTVRPAWVHGPFPSPYDNAVAYDNQILVASGIGITPALSVIRAHKDSRRINLIWAVRDQHLLAFILEHYLNHHGWNLIFYTGKEKLRMPHLDVLKNTNICIIEGRPRLHELIPNIIYGIESRLGLPENYTPTTRTVVSEMLADRLIDISNDSTRACEAAEDLACYASELGFHLPTEKVSRDFHLLTSQEFSLGRLASQKLLMNHLSIGFRPWDKHQGAKDYINKLDPNLVLKTWGMLYCGGAKMVLADLEKISDDYQLGLHVESFAW